MFTPLKHHPDCYFWLDNYKSDCTCGLTGGQDNKLNGQRPFTVTEWDKHFGLDTLVSMDEDTSSQ